LIVIRRIQQELSFGCGWIYEEDLNISEIDLEKSKKNYLDEKNLTKSSNKIIKITTMDNNLYKSAPFHKSK